MNADQLKHIEAVASFLGATVESKRENLHLIVFDDIFRLYVRQDWRKNNKIYVSPQLPESVTTSSGHDLPKIGLSLSRPALALAKDIKRRLLPDAREYIKNRMTYDRMYKAEQLAIQEEIAEILAENGTSPEKANHHSNQYYGHNFTLERPYKSGGNSFYRASVNVKSKEALKMIAKICKEDSERCGFL